MPFAAVVGMTTCAEARNERERALTMVVVDRRLQRDQRFIEGTRADDGDHTDALLVIDEPTFTGCHVWARPVGVLEMRDEKGADYKVLCVAEGDAHQAHIERLDQIRPHRLVEIEHFFETYKLLEDKTVEVLGWRDRDRAHEILRADSQAWQREQAASE
jgi:inorganic pyrophosphatase